MLILMTAAVAAAQPAPAANPPMHHAQMQQGQMAPMQNQQHQAMREGCACCKNMGQHDRHMPGAQPQDRRGQ